MTDSPIRLDREGPLAILTVDKPPVNLYAEDIHQGLEDAIAEVERDRPRRPSPTAGVHSVHPSPSSRARKAMAGSCTPLHESPTRLNRFGVRSSGDTKPPLAATPAGAAGAASSNSTGFGTYGRVLSPGAAIARTAPSSRARAVARRRRSIGVGTRASRDRCGSS